MLRPDANGQNTGDPKLAADALLQKPLAEILFPDLPEITNPNPYAGEVRERVLRNRLKADVILVLKQQGYTNREIGRIAGMTPEAVRKACTRARAVGRLSDLRGILEHDSLALAIDSLNHHLRKRDKDATFETLRGLGQFRNFHDNKNSGTGGGGHLPSLSVTFVQAPGTPVPTAVTVDAAALPALEGQVLVPPPVDPSAPLGAPRTDDEPEIA